MFEKISREIKLNATIMEDKGVHRIQVAAAFGISESTIDRAQKSKKKYGDVEARKQKPGPKSKFPPDIQDVCLRICVSMQANDIRRFCQWFSLYLMHIFQSM